MAQGMVLRPSGDAPQFKKSFVPMVSQGKETTCACEGKGEGRRDFPRRQDFDLHCEEKVQISQTDLIEKGIPGYRRC